jgi:hypothetical protein
MVRTFWKATALATAAVMVWATAAMADPATDQSISINGGAATTDSLSVTVTVAVVHCPPGGDLKGLEVSFSNTSATGPWTVVHAEGTNWPGADADGCTGGDPTSPTTGFNWTLAGGADGERTVYARFRHGSDVVAAQDSITFQAPPSDTTPPVITPNVSGTLGNNGWYVSDVTVSWTVVDDESAISSTSGCDPITINADTAGTTLTCTATSAGGTGSEPVTIKRDASAPTLNPTVSPNPVLLNGSATATAGATDSLSGVASSSCGSVDTSNVGPNSVMCSATDYAGNSSSAAANYSVAFKFVGFTSPVDNPNVLNKAKAGQAIPFKWRLLDANDQPVTNLSSAGATVASLSCALGTTADALEEYATGSSGLQNLGNGYYQWNWKSPTSYANSCKTFKLDLGEGSPRTALFQFTK